MTTQEAWDACTRPDRMLWVHAASPDAAPQAYARLAHIWARYAQEYAYAHEDAMMAAWTSAQATLYATAAQHCADVGDVSDTVTATLFVTGWHWDKQQTARECDDIRAELSCPRSNKETVL